MLYDVDIEASACILSSRYAMLCYAVMFDLTADLAGIGDQSDCVMFNKQSILLDIWRYGFTGDMGAKVLTSESSCYRFKLRHCWYDLALVCIIVLTSSCLLRCPC